MIYMKSADGEVCAVPDGTKLFGDAIPARRNNTEVETLLPYVYAVGIAGTACAANVPKDISGTIEIYSTDEIA